MTEQTYNQHPTSNQDPKVEVHEHEAKAITLPRPLRRVSWGAIIAGVVIALLVQFTMELLGLAIGAATVDPAFEQNPLDSLSGTGVVVWLAASTLVAMFAGGWVAGRLANVPDVDGLIHGLVVWGAVVLISILLLSAGFGRVIGGAVNVIGEGLSYAARNVEQISPETADALNLEDVTLQRVDEEVRTLLRPSDTEAPPSEVQTTEDVTAAEEEVRLIVRRLLNMDEDVIEEADRDEVVNSLVAQTDLSEQEARELVLEWEQSYRDAQTQAEEALREAGQTVADTVARLAGISFATLLLGAFAGGAGGLVGSPEEKAGTVVATDV